MGISASLFPTSFWLASTRGTISSVSCVRRLQCALDSRHAREIAPTNASTDTTHAKGEEEERELVDWLDYGQRPTWRFGDFNGPSNRMNWGFEVNLRDRTIGKPRRPMPQILKSLAARMRGGGGDLLRDFHPDEANAIDYRKSKGHELLPHFDDRHLNGDILCNLSLLADATMTYVYGGKGGKRGRVAGVVDGVVDVLLPRRSLQVQTGDVRYAWKHSISNANLFGERRVSITFRTCRF